MTQQSKAPFYIIEEFVSPLMCEEIISQLDFDVPNVDKDGKPVSSVKTEADYELYLFEEFEKYQFPVAEHFNNSPRMTSEFTFNWFPTGSKQDPQSENSIYMNGKWVRTKDRDITCVLFLSDTMDNPNTFDEEFEVYGGKFEFPQHRFGFNANRGTLIAFPSEPHFINVVSPILAGNLYFAKFHLATATPVLFDPKKFPGDYRTWFKEHA